MRLRDWRRVLLRTVFLLECLAMRFSRDWFSWLSVVVLLAGWVGAGAIEAQERDLRGSDRAAIRRATQEYLTAIKRGRPDEIASFWTPDGVFVDEFGREESGRELAQMARPRDHADAAGAPRGLLETTIRLITADVALEEGIEPAAGQSDPTRGVGRFSAIWVKRDGRWLLDHVRESRTVAASPHDFLRPLAWMVGEWKSEDGDVRVRMRCDWSEDKQFLLREIHIAPPGGRPLVVTQRIGWDGSKRRVKAWSFDSTGGHGEAEWTPQGQRWLVKGTAITAEGGLAESQSSYTPDGDQALIWESSQAAHGGVALPDRKLRLVREAYAK